MSTLDEFSDHLSRAVANMDAATDLGKRMEQELAGIGIPFQGNDPKLVENLAKALAVADAGSAPTVIQESMKRHDVVGTFSILHLTTAILPATSQVKKEIDDLKDKLKQLGVLA